MSDSPTNPNPPGILPSDTFPTGPELSTQAAPSKPAFYKLFVGPDGIRAGWMLRICGAFYFGSFALNLRDGLYYGVTWGVAFLMVGFFEEYMFRGYVQYTLTTAIGFWPTAILLSFLFAFVHKFNPGETWVGLVD